jgi:hypothetical protein
MPITKSSVSGETDVYTKIGVALNEIVHASNYQVFPAMIKGKPGKNVKAMREYRLQLINKNNDTSQAVIDLLKKELNNSDAVSKLQYNPISPNSSKFPSYSFEVDGKMIDVVIARGANKGENFEVQTVKNLGNYFNTRNDTEFAKLVEQLNQANADFAAVEIKRVEQRKGSTKKEGVAIEKLGEIIGDIVLIDASNHRWYISLKDVNGSTFSSYSGAATIFDKNGTLQPNSPGADFLRAFGVDLNQVQAGFDERRKLVTIRSHHKQTPPNQNELKKIFERAWGMNYFYVRRQSTGWKVFWLDRNKLNDFTSNIRVTNIKYPNAKSKQISIFAESAKGQKYLIEIRNSKAGEYPNDIKFKVIP